MGGGEGRGGWGWGIQQWPVGWGGGGVIVIFIAKIELLGAIHCVSGHRGRL